MNTDSGEFVDEQRAEAWMERIGVGEVVNIKGAEMEVTKIGRREITLRLLSASDRLARSRNYEDDREAEIERQRAKMLKHQR